MLADRTVRCWGNNAQGQLGEGSREHVLTAVTVPALTAVEQVSAGNRFTCAVSNGGELRCWGDNQFGALGDGTMIPRAAPVLSDNYTSPTQPIM